MTTYTAPVATVRLFVPAPTGWNLNDACNHIKGIVTETPKVQATPAPNVLLDRGGPENAIQIVITFAPEGDAAGAIKNDILRAIDEQMENPGRRQRVA
jgi:hypothetical protein